MDVSSGFEAYVDRISTVGGELGPMVVKGMMLLIIVLILMKYPGASRFISSHQGRRSRKAGSLCVDGTAYTGPAAGCTAGA